MTDAASPHSYLVSIESVLIAHEHWVNTVCACVCVCVCVLCCFVTCLVV